MMDLSKLPRLSDTQKAAKDAQSAPEASSDSPAPPPAASPAANTFCFQCGAALRPGARFCDSCGTALGGNAGADPAIVGAEAWISIALGFLLFFLYNRLPHYLITGGDPARFIWIFSDRQGNPITYTQSAFFWHDLGITVFAIVLILEGLVLIFSRNVIVVTAGFVLATAAVLLNLGVLGTTWNEIDSQIAPALAIIFGVYIAIYELRLLRAIRRR